MSDVQATIDGLRLKADFLARHRDLLDEVAYSSEVYSRWAQERHERAMYDVSFEAAMERWRTGEGQDFASAFRRYTESKRGRYAYPSAALGDVAPIYVSTNASYGLDFRVTGGTDDEKKEMVLRIRRAIGGTWKKQAYGSTFSLRQILSEDPYVAVEIDVDRDAVCTPVTERKLVTVPAVEAKTIEAQPERQEWREEVVDWDCGMLLSDEPQETVAA